MKTSYTLLVAIFFQFIFLSTISSAEMLSVTGENVNLRSGPSKQYQVKWEYGKGFPIKVIKKKGDWIKVADFENDTGWIFKPLLEKTPHMIVKVNKNKKKKINIRSGPGTKFNVVGQAYYGVVFRTIEQKKGWARVKHESGLEGWIKRSLLWGF